jgi:hypothetical protein
MADKWEKVFLMTQKKQLLDFQVDEGLKSLESAMSCGFDNYDQIRKDKNLEGLRRSPKFQVWKDGAEALIEFLQLA